MADPQKRDKKTGKGADTYEVLRKKFEVLKEEVPIYVFTREEENQPFNRFLVAFVKELQKLTPKILPFFHEIGDETSKLYNVSRSPTVLIYPERYKIRYTGSPAGEEMRSFLDAIVMVSMGRSVLSTAARDRLAELKEARHIRVFVNPT